MRFFFFLLLAFLQATAVHAQVPLQSKSDKPVAIEADQQLEWLRNENKFRATGHVTITQGDTVITGDEAEATYDAAQGPSALTLLTVTGHVVITAGENVITSETASYDTRTEVAQLRGSIVTLTAPKATVSAQTGMDYFARERKAVSKGPAVVTQGTDTLKARAITAWLTEQNDLSKATAQGNVIITQKAKDGTSNIAQADRGDYDAVKKTVSLNGNVRLTQGQNHMQGDKATMDLNTGYSALQNNPASGGRVRAVFTPAGDKEGDSSAKSFINSSAIPTIAPKKDYQQPYAVGKK